MNKSYFKATIVPIIGEITNMVHTHGIATQMEAMKPALRLVATRRIETHKLLVMQDKGIREMLDSVYVGLRG